MALHGFNDEGWKQYKADRKHLHGGKRQVHLRKNFERRGKGGGRGALATIVHGPAASTVSSGTYTLTLSECQVMQGRIPEDVTTITAADTHAWDIQEDQLVWVMLASDKEVGVDNFLTFQAGCPPEV